MYERKENVSLSICPFYTCHQWTQLWTGSLYTLDWKLPHSRTRNPLPRILLQIKIKLFMNLSKKKWGGKFNLNVIICIWTPLFTPILLQKGFPCDSSRSFSPQTCSFFSFLFFLFLGDFLKKLWKLFKGKCLLVKTWWQSTELVMQVPLKHKIKNSQMK